MVGNAEYMCSPLFRTFLGVFGGVGKWVASIDSLAGKLMVGIGGSGASGAGDLDLLLPNFSAWPKLPLRLRRLEKDFFRFMLGGSISSVDMFVFERAGG